jgi:hypothetical protein
VDHGAHADCDHTQAPPPNRHVHLDANQRWLFAYYRTRFLIFATDATTGLSKCLPIELQAQTLPFGIAATIVKTSPLILA